MSEWNDDLPFAGLAEWPVETVSAITTKIGSGATPRGGARNYLGERDHYALVRSQNVFDRYLDRQSLAFISDDQARRLKGVELKAGDLLLNITGDGVTFGRACLVPPDVLPAVVNQHVAFVRVDPEQADSRYMLSYLTHPMVKPYLESFNSGGSRRALTKAHIESFRLPLPTLPEQRRIAAVLGSLDDLIEADKNLCISLRELGRSLLAASLHEKESKLVKLGGVVRSISRGVAPRYVEGALNGSLILNQKCIRNHQVAISKARRMEPRVLPREKRVCGGDILVCSTGTGTLGRVGRWHEGDVYADGHVSIVQPDSNQVAPTVLAYCLFDSEADIEDLGTGSTGQTELSPQRLKELLVALPSTEVQGRLEPMLMMIEVAIARLGDEIADLTRLRDELLPLLMSGRIRVSENVGPHWKNEGCADGDVEGE